VPEFRDKFVLRKIPPFRCILHYFSDRLLDDQFQGGHPWSLAARQAPILFAAALRLPLSLDKATEQPLAEELPASFEMCPSN